MQQFVNSKIYVLITGLHRLVSMQKTALKSVRKARIDPKPVSVLQIEWEIWWTENRFPLCKQNTTTYTWKL